MSNAVISKTDVGPDTTIINPGAQLDNENAHEMVDAIARAQDDGYKYIIIDMRVLEFMSSSGVGSILGSVEVSRDRGGDIILCNVSEAIRNILQVLDLLEFMTMAPDVDTALEKCRGNG